MTARTAGLTRPHAYDPGSRTPVKCLTCGKAKRHRIHQPLWWRVLHPGARWR